MTAERPVETFRQWVDRLSYPTTLRGEVGRRLVQSYALIGDIINDLTMYALEARFLAAVNFPHDAAPLIGSERMMPRYESESLESYKRRLGGAWKAWAQAGTAAAVVSQLALSGINAYIRENHQWNWDGNAAESRFWVVITGHPYSTWVYGRGTRWGDGTTWGSSITYDQLRFLRRIIRKWRPAHRRCAGIVMVTNRAQWDAEQPDGTWGDLSRRSRAALYFSGHGA